METPAELRYTSSHEWVRLEGDEAVVGITDYAQHELTDVVYVELPEVGLELTPGDSCAVVESTKVASDIYAPLAGTVLAVNADLTDHPEQVNASPYEHGWLFRIKLADPSAWESLQSATEYADSIN